MEKNFKIFEFIGEQGEHFILYEDGTTSGFPPGAKINRMKPVLNMFRGTLLQISKSIASVSPDMLTKALESVNSKDSEGN